MEKDTTTLKDIILAHDITMRSFADACGLHEQTLQKHYASRNPNYRVQTLRRIHRGMLKLWNEDISCWDYIDA